MEWSRRSTVVTGGAGFIGHHLIRRLLDEGADVGRVDDESVCPLLPRLGHLVGTDLNELTARDLRGVDTVFHLAANKSVPRSFEKPDAAEENLRMAQRLVEAACGAGVRRLVIASSCEVYGIANILPTPEETKFAPRSPYAEGKVAVEELMQDVQALEDAPIVAVARLFNVYGPGERPDALVPRLCASAISRGELPIEGDGEQRRDLSYVSDVVEKLARLGAASTTSIVNVGSGRSRSVLDIAELIASKVAATMVHRTSRPNEIPEFLADTSRERTLLGTVNRVPVEVGVMQTLQWWCDRDADYAGRALTREEE
uniref:dTDP-glucose 4,6-dehydratase/UDP-glucose 4-epimerase n=1 Tax=Rathayibacter sp. FH 236 TaxID=2615183 RepID=A0A5J6SFZ1_9MICO|nr:dTDP-glucose 4,6-dehydratase/UDP-glucose 4-epimerase [Rathayibacter sp. FH 236]